MKRISRRHAPHREELKLARLALHFRYGFELINLSLLTTVVAPRHERDPAAEFLPPFPHVPHGDFGDRKLEMLVAQSRPDTMRHRPLFPRRLPVCFRYLVESHPSRDRSSAVSVCASFALVGSHWRLPGARSLDARHASWLNSCVTSIPGDRRGERLATLYIHAAMDPAEFWRQLGETELPKLWMPKREDKSEAVVTAQPLLMYVTFFRDRIR